MSAPPDNASEFAFVAAGGALTKSMGLDDRACGLLDGVWVRWQWDAYDLALLNPDGSWSCWNRCWVDFEAPCTAEGWLAWRASVKVPSGDGD